MFFFQLNEQHSIHLYVLNHILVMNEVRPPISQDYQYHFEHILLIFHLVPYMEFQTQYLLSLEEQHTFPFQLTLEVLGHSDPKFSVLLLDENKLKTLVQKK